MLQLQLKMTIQIANHLGSYFQVRSRLVFVGSHLNVQNLLRLVGWINLGGSFINRTVERTPEEQCLKGIASVHKPCSCASIEKRVG